MGCVYHPDREATKYCDQCEADLCESCSVRLEDGRTFCNRCMVAFSVNDVTAEEAKRKLAGEARRLGLDKKWRPNYIQVVLMIGALLAMALIGLRIYWSHPVPHRKAILNPANPMRLFANLQTALEHYAITNGGSYPDKLFELLPKYIDNVAKNRRVLRQLHYELDLREGYVLKIKDKAPLPGKELVVTAKGVRPSGVKPSGGKR